jgi:hypothetical protein
LSSRSEWSELVDGTRDGCGAVVARVEACEFFGFVELARGCRGTSNALAASEEDEDCQEGERESGNSGGDASDDGADGGAGPWTGGCGARWATAEGGKAGKPDGRWADAEDRVYVFLLRGTHEQEK